MLTAPQQLAYTIAYVVLFSMTAIFSLLAWLSGRRDDTAASRKAFNAWLGLAWTLVVACGIVACAHVYQSRRLDYAFARPTTFFRQ